MVPAGKKGFVLALECVAADDERGGDCGEVHHSFGHFVSCDAAVSTWRADREKRYFDGAGSTYGSCNRGFSHPTAETLDEMEAPGP